MRRASILVIVLIPLLAALSSAQKIEEKLLSDTENAYKPIPSPDAKVIAYVRTGWGQPGGSGGFGRSNLRSEIAVMTTSGITLSRTPLADAFLSGWTSDGNNHYQAFTHLCAFSSPFWGF